MHILSEIRNGEMEEKSMQAFPAARDIFLFFQPADCEISH